MGSLIGHHFVSDLKPWRPTHGACRIHECSLSIAARPLVALVGEFSRHLSQVEGWVPQVLNELVFRVCQRSLLLVVNPHSCDGLSEYEGLL
jgi:hypothetical protein